MAGTSKTGYVNGSDMLLKVAGGAIGHCTTHTVTLNSETRERAVKPVASASISTSLFKGKSVVGLSASISFEGLSFYEETETGYKTIASKWAAGTKVSVQCFEREAGSSPYLSGDFVITSLERVDAANEDATYSGTLENDGAITITANNITGETVS